MYIIRCLHKRRNERASLGVGEFGEWGVWGLISKKVVFLARSIFTSHLFYINPSIKYAILTNHEGETEK